MAEISLEELIPELTQLREKLARGVCCPADSSVVQDAIVALQNNAEVTLSGDTSISISIPKPGKKT